MAARPDFHLFPPPPRREPKSSRRCTALEAKLTSESAEPEMTTHLYRCPTIADCCKKRGFMKPTSFTSTVKPAEFTEQSRSLQERIVNGRHQHSYQEIHGNGRHRATGPFRNRFRCRCGSHLCAAQL